MTREIYVPQQHQRIAERHLEENPRAGLFLDMGLGKTVVTLTDIAKWKRKQGKIKVLVIAPLYVAKFTWSDEMDKWEHLKGLKYAKVLGSEKKRLEGLRSKADVYLINRENVDWLIGYMGSGFNFDYVVIDESTSFKNPRSKRFKALRKVCRIPEKFVILTGTPAPKSLIDLWSQVYLLDGGERLGTHLTHFRDRYFNAGSRNGYTVYEYVLKKGDALLGKDWYEREIHDAIKDICISMKTDDWVELPERIDRYVNLRLEGKALNDYRTFERDSVLELAEKEITALTAASLTNKLLQYANGAVYTERPAYEEVHAIKMAALDEIMEASNGHPVMVFYNFKSDAERIEKHLKRYKPRRLKTEKDKDDWNKGEIDLFLLHPKSAGHGLNLQAGGNIIVWFSLTWSLEEYMQANKRLHRKGQKNAVIVHHLVMKDTLDDTVVDTLEDKAATQDDLLEALIVRMSKYL